jgi:heme-degrading monooxygenase HmoA
MIERHVTFHVLPDKEAEFEVFFKEDYAPAMAETEGFVSANLLQDQEISGDMKMVLVFETLESAAAWRASQAHENLKPRLKSLYDGSELTVYDVVVERDWRARSG